MKLISHRGVHNNTIGENTILSITTAIRQGFDAVEIDIRSSKDNVIVLNHDQTIKNVFGVSLKISAINYDDLKLSCKGLATLEEVLENFPENNILIEIKDLQTFENSQLKSLPKNYLFQSFKFSQISKFAKEVKNTCGLLFPTFNLNLILKFFFRRRKFWETLKQNNIQFLSITSSLINRKLIDDALANGIDLYIWTIKEKSQLEKFKQLGVENIITEVI